MTGEGLRSALEALVRSRFPEGLARRLESRYSLTDGELADDAVAAAVEQILRYSKSIHVDNLEAYLTASAHNVLRRLLKKKKNRGLDDLEYDETEGDALVRSEEGGRRVYELAKAEIETWEGEKMALITHLVVQATFLGEVLTTEELRDAAEPILDEVLTLDAVKTLKKRGLERLAAAFAEMGYTIDQLEES